MEGVKDFVMSRVCAAASSALIEGFIPEGSLKRYVKYLISLVILAVLVSPLVKVVKDIPTLTYYGYFGYDATEASIKANSVVAMHIERALKEKFSIPDKEISVKYNGEGVTVTVKSKPWLYEGDIIIYTANNFGVAAEVSFYE